MNSIIDPPVRSDRDSDKEKPAGNCCSCCAVLLRGGRSRRMGRDKALLPWKESTFLETIASQLEFLDEKYLSVAAEGSDSHHDCRSAAVKNGKEDSGEDGREDSREDRKKDCNSNQDTLPDEWVRLPDLIPDCGPLGGIYTALRTCRAEWALVVSCDVPAVEQRFFKMLMEDLGSNLDIIYPITPDGRMHMTCAVYRKEIAPILLRQIEKGDNRLRVLPDLCRAKGIRIDHPDLIRMVSNINTGEEFDRILNR